MVTTTKYVPPHRRRKQQASGICEQSQPREKNPKQIMFFGDSFVRLFGLIKHPDLNVEGFTGATAKGLGRVDNKTRASIRQQIKQHKPERVVLCFGSVDVHLSYYYNKYHKGGPTIDLEAVAEAYVEFAATLHVEKTHIIGLYPSPLKPEHVAGSLVAYGTILEGVHISQSDITSEARKDRVCEFNRALEEACSRHGLAFENPFFDVYDPSTNLLKPKFQDNSVYNIHVVWETTVLLWLSRWPWFRALSQPGLQKSLEDSLEKYLLTKPWAETQHVAAKMGVEGSFDFANTDT